jgi:MFS transporter, putative metabolite:H+ symporter
MDQHAATSTLAGSSAALGAGATQPDAGSLPRTVSEYLDALTLNRRHCMVFVVSALGFFFDALDLQILALAVPSIAKEWSLAPNSIGWLFSLTAFGMLAGSYVFGTLADYIGRRLCFQLTIAIFAVSSGLCYFAENAWQLGALRVLTGFGIGGFIPVDTAIMSEFIPARKRGLIFGLWNLFFSVGYIVSAKIAAFVVPNYGWRALFIVGVVPAFLVLFVRLLIPESPRFLMMRGRLDEARRSVAWISGKPLSQDASALFVNPKQVESGSRITFIELFSPAYRSRTAFTWCLWFSLMFCYLGLVPWLPTLLGRFREIPMSEVFGIMIAFSASGIAGRLAVAALVDRLGRRTMMIPLAACALVAALCFGQQTELNAIWWWACALGFFLDGVLGNTATMTPELYPTRARATGIGWAQSMGRIGAILAPLAIGVLVPFGVEWVFVMFAVALSFVILATLLFRVETRQLSLEKASGESA